MNFIPTGISLFFLVLAITSVFAEIPTELKFRETVLSTFVSINTTISHEFLQEYSSYPNRFYNSSTGVEASEWLMRQINSTIYNAIGETESISIRFIEHPNWPQKSIIVRLEGNDCSLKQETIILGAHLDSVSGDAPGADDNGSGTVVILEVLRVILTNKLKLQRTVEFHWYAAEEVGLLGSYEIAAAYNIAGVKVLSMLNLDVVGWKENSSLPHVAFVTVQTDESLTQFLRLIAQDYLQNGWIDRVCANGCSSDHRSWNEFKFPSAFAIEPTQNPYMHTMDDKIEYVNFEQIQEFIKLGLGYVIEISEPVVENYQFRVK